MAEYLSFTYDSELEGYVLTGVDLDVFNDLPSPQSFIIPSSYDDGINEKLPVVAIDNINSDVQNLQTDMVLIPGSVKTIAEGAFYQCTNAQLLVLGRGIETIGEDAFYQFGSVTNKITEIVLPNSIINIGANAFGGIGNLKKIVFDGTQEEWEAKGIDLESICGKNLDLDLEFRPYTGDDKIDYIYNEQINAYEIKGNIEKAQTITSEIFYLNPLPTYDDGIHGELPVTQFRSQGFMSIYEKDDDVQFSQIHMIMPDTITDIDGQCFNGTNKITLTRFSKRLSYIGNYGFSSTRMKKLEIQALNTGCYLGNYCFSYMPNLSQAILSGIDEVTGGVFTNSAIEYVDFGENIAKFLLGERGYLFYGCEKLQTVIIRSDKVPELSKSLWPSSGDGSLSQEVTIYVPEEMVEDYENHGYWGLYTIKDLSAAPAPPVIDDDPEIPEEPEDPTPDIPINPDAQYAIVDTTWLEGNLTNIAKAIRTEAGLGEENLLEFPQGMINAIESIKGQGNSENKLNKLAKNTLTHVTLADLEGATEIKYGLFATNTALLTIEIPSTVTRFEYYAFDGCTFMTSVYYDGDVSQWCGIEVQGNYASPRGDFYFKKAQGEYELVTELVIPNSITQIKSFAFQWCNSITSVTISDSVKTIGSHAFRYCLNLTSVTIGSGVESIGVNAFYNCRKVKSVTILSTDPPAIDSSNIFAFADDCIFYVKGVTNYENATNWDYYTDIYEFREIEE